MINILIVPILLFSSVAFAEEVTYEKALETNKDTLIIFGTDWCGACKNLKKDLHNLQLKNYDFCVINAEKRKDLAKKYQVNSYPTSIILRNKEVASKKIGYSKIEYENWLDENKKEPLAKPDQEISPGCEKKPDCGPEPSYNPDFKNLILKVVSIFCFLITSVFVFIRGFFTNEK